jgi:hypothetical protein
VNTDKGELREQRLEQKEEAELLPKNCDLRMRIAMEAGGHDPLVLAFARRVAVLVGDWDAAVICTKWVQEQKTDGIHSFVGLRNRQHRSNMSAEPCVHGTAASKMPH